jgi:hypothetical protein
MVGTPSGGAPVQFGTLQECSVDFSFSTKPLMGQFQFPVAVARGAGKITGSAKFANIDGAVFNEIFFGLTGSTGQKLVSYNEPGSIPAVSTYTITVAQSAHFDEDLGVQYASSGLRLLQVASGPTVGQYSVNQSTGVYTFAAADEGKAVLISYSYTTTASGLNTVITNKLMGISPNFQIDFYNSNPNIAGAQWSLRLYACMSSKLTLASKLEDFTIPEMGFEAFANAANNIGEINTAY